MRSNKPLEPATPVRETLGKTFTIKAAEVRSTQYGDIAVFTTDLPELGGKVKSFNQAILTDAKAMVAGKIALPKKVKTVNVKSGKSGRTYIALEEA